MTGVPTSCCSRLARQATRSMERLRAAAGRLAWGRDLDVERAQRDIGAIPGEHDPPKHQVA